MANTIFVDPKEGFRITENEGIYTVTLGPIEELTMGDPEKAALPLINADDLGKIPGITPEQILTVIKDFMRKSPDAINADPATMNAINSIGEAILNLSNKRRDQLTRTGNYYSHGQEEG